MSKKAQLVCQHLENISRAALEEHQDIVRQFVRGRQGVCALYRKGKLYYIGLATNLRNRLKHHLKDRHGLSWDRFSVYLTIGDHHLRELEALMLRVMKPTGNKQKGQFVHSDDLSTVFRRAIRDSMLADLDGIFVEPRRPSRKIRPVLMHPPGRRPVLAKFSKRPSILKARFKGTTLTARVRRDGTIRFAGQLYTSPSVAAARACKRVSCNGWVFWQFERAPGDWVSLDTLRQ
jgi:predicted GIY-YIG superfamily endonuclease